MCAMHCQAASHAPPTLVFRTGPGRALMCRVVCCWRLRYGGVCGYAMLCDVVMLLWWCVLAALRHCDVPAVDCCLKSLCGVVPWFMMSCADK